MTVGELIEKLKAFPSSTRVMVYDGDNEAFYPVATLRAPHPLEVVHDRLQPTDVVVSD